jgi:hypothetical protein
MSVVEMASKEAAAVPATELVVDEETTGGTLAAAANALGEVATEATPPTVTAAPAEGLVGATHTEVAVPEAESAAPQQAVEMLQQLEEEQDEERKHERLTPGPLSDAEDTESSQSRSERSTTATSPLPPDVDDGGSLPASAGRGDGSNGGNNVSQNSTRSHRDDNDNDNDDDTGVRNAPENHTVRSEHAPPTGFAAADNDDDDDEYSSDEPDVDDETGGANLNESTLPMIETEVEDSHASMSSEDE